MRHPFTAARWCYAVIALVVAVSFTIQLVLLFTGGADANSGASESSVDVGTRLVRLFSYFTIDSNLIVLGVALALVIRPARDGALWRVVHLDAVLGIVITGLVFATVLVHQVHLTGAAFVATVGFHYVTPLAMLAAWLVFGPRPAFTWRTVAWAFLWPAVWIGYTFAHGAATDWYPYPFLDAATKGYGHALTATGLVVLLALVIATGLRLLGPLPALLRPDPASETMAP